MDPAIIRPKRIERVEKLNYCVGGFHPIHLNDTFKHGRYTVIHKLGHGGLLLPEHVGKSHVMSMLDHFFHTGPNGKHLCLVSEVGGPSIKQFNECPGQYQGSRRLDASVARNVCLQAVNGLDYIHSIGIVHGDLTPANILLQLANIDEWTVERIYERLGVPQKQELVHSSPSVPKSSFPDYTVVTIDMKEVDPKWLSDEIIIIDFGIAFVQKSPSLSIGTPKSYCAPEFLFGSHRSIASDIWALGCTIFEIRTGSRLFKYDGIPTRDEMLIAIVKLLGRLPEKWWDAWTEGLEWYEKQTEIPKESSGNILKQIMETGAHDGEFPPQRIRCKDEALAHVENYKKLSSQSILDTTGKLVAMAENLNSKEAAEVLRLAYDQCQERPNYGSNGDVKIPGSRSPNAKSSDAKSSEAKNSEGKSSEKTPSSEGISTGISKGKTPPKLSDMPEDSQSDGPANTDSYESVIGNVIQEMAPSTKVEILFGPSHVQSFLEPSGSRISISEAESLEDLLRLSLKFLPEERTTTLKLSKHIWFSEIPNECDAGSGSIITSAN